MTPMTVRELRVLLEHEEQDLPVRFKRAGPDGVMIADAVSSIEMERTIYSTPHRTHITLADRGEHDARGRPALILSSL